ncbi:cadherin domain-containing protein [Williamwhitmania taraxaci]|uniref:Por secretion system C-terminal sorting domain-containing protein n=1 Tax=Williamwhitmania taraxaci TaxID=1640674 RepID=A0A1G6L1Q7_9BACT|nr:cadherin domain-containing protein [Williamwhitmania taraxaci]SDC37260.1 Por secretion system C-terminal sorting domain-containing protein [Williamwhitmania taraxaci]
MRNYFTQGTIKRMRSYERSELNSARVFGMTDILYETNSLSYLRNLGRLIFVVCISLLFFLTGASAQTTETFESFSMGATSFTSNSVPFTLNPSGGAFAVDVYNPYGYLSSSNFIDNLTSLTNPCQIKSTSTFSVKSLYLYPSDNGGNSNQTSGVTVTLTGKLGGTTKFTYSPPSSDFASASYTNSTNRGFSLVNFATPGYDNIAIDELEITLGGTTNYFAIDNFTWGAAVVNNAPTDIALSASAINENVVANSTVGTLSTTDPDVGNTFTYTLVAGTGSTDNASFNISGSSLRITSSPDFETKSSYSVRVRTTDQGSLSFEKAFTITINDVAEAPTDVALSASSISENVAANSTVGTLSSTDPDAGNTFTYTLVAGTGSTDNASFNISGSSLRITASPDFETKSSYSVRVRTTDQSSLTYEKAFTITINNVNETPTDIALSASSINENVAANSTIGSLSSTDPDAGNTFTYTLVTGTGSTDNALFNISGSSLRITASPDFETKSSYSVRVRTTDQGSLTYEKAFTITINNVNESPTDIAISASAINENVAGNSTVGSLSSTDPDAGNTFTYTLVAGTGSTDNASFNISGSNLRITASPDFETKSSYTVRVRTTDQGTLFFEKAFTITISDVNEAPTDIVLSASAINENVAANSAVGSLSSTDPDAGNTFTYTLVTGTGSTDNASFNISGSSLRITASPDFETKSSYSVRVRTTDQSSLTYEKAFTITINNVNESPTDVEISASAINENVAGNTTVGLLSSTDPDAGNTFTYTLVVGTGSTDNASFNISGSSLRITASPNFETKSSYSVRVRTTDQGNLTYEKAFTVTINDLNEAPTDVALSASSINENVSANSTIGTLSSTDADAANTFTYTLVAGTGGTDNASFNISGSNLRITASPDFETKSSYSVRVRTTDQGSLSFEKAFTITINNVNETPVVTPAQSFSINENLISGTVVGTVVATDPDAGTTFSGWAITANVNPNGDGSSAFAINAATGQITVADAGDLDREINSSLTIKVTVSDGTNTSAEEDVTINLNDLNDVAPVVTAAQVFYVAEQSPNGTPVGTVLATDGDVTATTFQNWTITAGNSSGYFAINSSSGAITVVDNTGLNSAVNPSFTLTLTVSDGTNTSSSQTVSIIVSAVNDENPVITAAQSFAIDENANNSTAVGLVLATDPDYGTLFQGWTITAGNTSDAFAIDASTGAITVNQSSALDFETTPTFTLSVTVSDGLHTSATETLTINLTNVNDNTPEITSTSFTIDENSPVNFVVGKVEVSDKDGDLNPLTVTIKGGNTGDAFAYDNASGNLVVKTVTPVDFEVNPEFSLELEVSDGTLSSTKVVKVILRDVIETGVDEQLFSAISAYPNPCSGTLFIDIPATTSVSDISVTDVNGKLVYREQPSGLEQTIKLDMSSMKQGVYFVVLQGNGQKKILRVVKQ